MAIIHVVEVTDSLNLNAKIDFTCKKRVFLVLRWHYFFWWSSGDNKYIHTGTPMFQNSHTPVSYDLLGVSQHKLNYNVALSYTNQDLDEKCRQFYLFTNLQA